MRTLQIDFMGKRKIALIVSVSLLLVALLSLATRGLNQGLDFTGGSLLEVGFSQEVDPEDVYGPRRVPASHLTAFAHRGSLGLRLTRAINLAARPA